MHDFAGNQIAEKNSCLIEKLFKYDALFIAGQAKSHCVAWTIDDLLKEIRAVDSSLTEKIYVLEDCMSPVVIPNVIDYTDTAEEAFQRFSEDGMHVIRSTEPLESLPGIKF
jgi:nicotinamidase-related amidase